MKIQDVKKECLATVGLSVEFSNSEINSIDRLLWTVQNAVKEAVNQATTIGRETGKQYDFKDDVPAAIDLRDLKKIEWLLAKIICHNTSDLFNEANREFEAEINSINNSLPHATLTINAQLEPV